MHLTLLHVQSSTPNLLENAIFNQPKYSVDDIEEQLQINHLGHFLLCSLLLPDMQKAKDARMIIVGSITGEHEILIIVIHISNSSLNSKKFLRFL